MRHLLHGWFHRPKNVSLHYVMAVPPLVQIVVAVGITGFLSLQNGYRAVNEVAQQLQGKITEQIQVHVENQIDTAQRINRLNAEAIRRQQFDLQDLSALERHFWYQLREFSAINAIRFGTQDGGFVEVARTNDGRFQTRVQHPTDGKGLNLYQLDKNGYHTKWIKAIADYSFSTQIWYRSSLKAGQASWRQTNFTSAEIAQPSVHARLPVYAAKNELLGVTAVDLNSFSEPQFLNTLSAGWTGEAFIIDRQGQLISTSTDQAVLKQGDQGFERLNVSESPGTVTRAAAQFLIREFGSLADVTKSESLAFSVNRQRQFLQVTPLSDDKGLDWLIVVVVPESDFVAQINANTYTTLLLGLGAFGLATFLSIVVTRRLTQPILQMAEASRAIADGNLNQTVSTHQIKELNVLAQSFNQMAQQLRKSFARLAQTNERLEIRVEKRTAEISEKNDLLEQEIRDRKRIETDLEQALEQAEEANQAKSTFLSNMSHELRTPLNVILGFTQLMARDGTLSTNQQQHLTTIGNSGDHLLNLINNVLDLSKIEAGKATLEETSVDLDAFLKELYQMLALQADSRQLQLIFTHDDLPPTVRLDEGKLRQVLVNLLGNALKFTQAGSITLKVTSLAPNTADANPASSNTSCRLHFEITDTGPGIEPKDLKTLFAPFARTSVGSSEREGTGLGLPISQDLVQLMGGEITVDSQVGTGTTFSFELPTTVMMIRPAQTLAAHQHIIGLQPGQPSYRILIAEDNPDSRRLLVELLTPVGFEVQTARDGQETLTVWRDWSPHFIWMDMRMPILSGYQVTQQIKAVGPAAPVIIALTGSAFEADRVAVLACGCNDFVRKPLRAEVIFAKMAEHLGVQYCYGAWSEDVATSATASVPQPAWRYSQNWARSLATMPTPWLQQLHQAATRVNASLVLSMIEEIPESNRDLAQALTHLVENFRFEEIVASTRGK